MAGQKFKNKAGPTPRGTEDRNIQKLFRRKNRSNNSKASMEDELRVDSDKAVKERS